MLWLCLLPVLAAAFRIVPTGILGSSRAQNCRQIVSFPNVPKPIVSHKSFRLSFGRKFFLAASKEEEVKDVFDSVFQNDVLDVDVLRDPNHFNDPEVCMVRGPVDFMRGSFFSNLTEIVGTIVNATKEPPNPSSKPFVALMKGSGGGKTRLVEEVRRRLLTAHSNILPVAITFNSKWRFPHSMEEEVWKCIDNVRSLSATTKFNAKHSISIILRVLCMVYRQDMSTIGSKLSGSPHFTSMLSRMTSFSYESLLRGFVMHLVGKAKQSCPQIDSFVLLMDETAKMYNEFGKKYFQDFRRALLDNETRLDGNRINVGLLITSLMLGPLDEGNSSRTVYFLQPRDPEVDEVVKDWWGLGWITKLKDHRPVMDMYRALASMFRRWLRASEYVLSILEASCRRAFNLTLQQVGEKLDDGQWRASNQAEVREMLVDAASNMINERNFTGLENYRTVPSDDHVSRMVFNTPRPITADSIYLVRDNFISDALKSLVGTGPEESRVLTARIGDFNVSMFALYLSARNRSSGDAGFSTAEDFVRIVQGLNELVSKNIASSNNNTGLLLEQFDRSYLWFRLQVAAAAGNCNITVDDLLNTVEAFGHFGPVRLQKKRDVFQNISDLGNTYSPKVQLTVANKLLDITVDASNPYKIIIPHKDECFDFAFKYYDPTASGSSRLLFFDAKMKLTPDRWSQKFPRDQHKHMSAVMAQADATYARESCVFIYRSTKTAVSTNANISEVVLSVPDDGNAEAEKSRLESFVVRNCIRDSTEFAFDAHYTKETNVSTFNVTEVAMPRMIHGVDTLRKYYGFVYEFYEICLSRVCEIVKDDVYKR